MAGIFYCGAGYLYEYQAVFYDRSQDVIAASDKLFQKMQPAFPALRILSKIRLIQVIKRV